MDFIKSEIKNIVIFVAILGGLYFAYTSFFGKDSASPTVTVNTTADGGSVGGEILPLLLELKKIKLDQFILTDPSYQKLTNFSVELLLTEEEKGRTNPFAPLDAGAATSSAQINVSVGTLGH